MSRTTDPLKSFDAKKEAGIQTRLLTRLMNSLVENTGEVRTGECTPGMCETLDGIKGNACCKLDRPCNFLQGGNCNIYEYRLPNCRAFPHSSADIKLVKNCGYSFKPAVEIKSEVRT